MEGRGYSLVGSVDMCSVQGANQRSPDCEYRQGLCLLSWKVSIRLVHELEADIGSDVGFSGYLVLWDDLKRGRQECIVLIKTARLLETGAGNKDMPVMSYVDVVYNHNERRPGLGDSSRKS
jgi:hypothetical protein